MNKRIKRGFGIFLAVVLLLGTLPMTAGAAGETGDFTVTGGRLGTDYSYDGTARTLTIKTGIPLTISGNTTKDKIVVDSNERANITLNEVNIDVNDSVDCAFEIKAGTTVKLTLAAGTDNILISGRERAGLEVPDRAELTIGGAGTLKATGSIYSAGIGGSSLGTGGTTSGKITITDNAHVTATGATGGAGIGGSAGDNGGGNGGEIVISGSAWVEAIGTDGAGIGGGGGDTDHKGGDGGTITISGNATVIAKGLGSAGIGGGKGSGGGAGGMITISEKARVTATGSDGGAGIGGGALLGGSGGAGGIISIKDNAHVTARSFFGASEGAGIGGGSGDTVPGGAAGTIAISGGTVVAEGGYLGIGGGSGTSVGDDGSIQFTGPVSLSANSLGNSTITGTGAVTVPAGVTLTIPARKTLTDDGTLINKGTLTNSGVVTGNGILTGDGTFDGNGIYTLSTIPAPAVASKTQTSVTLSAVTPVGGGTVTYAKNTGSTVPALGWQADLTFDGLNPGTTYYFFAHVTDGAIFQDATSHGTKATTDSAPDPVVPSGGSDDDDEGYDTDRETVDAVKQAKDGETVELDLPPSGKVPNEVLEAAAGKDVILEISAGDGVTWIIHGKDIPKGKLADLNLKVDAKANTIPVTVINALTGEKQVMQLALSHNGDFPFPLTLRLEVGKESAGLWANLYYYDEAAGVLDYQSSAKIGEKGAADLPFAHASSYAVVIDAESHGALPFADVKEGDWCYEGVRYVYNSGLLRGTGETAFSPNGPMTRGMFVTALYRLAGQPQDAGEGGAFTDVPGSAYYADAVTWASALGIVRGVTADTFAPDRPVTRQQMAVIMANYAQAMGHVLPTVREDVTFTDQSAIAPWAAEAVAAMQRSGIMGGKVGGDFDPAGTATRAQAAVVLQRFTEAAGT